MSKKTSIKSAGTKGKQVFSFNAPTAMSVQLAGDFTRWQEQPIPMRKTADGIWRTTLEMQPGEYHYRFLVDGEWRDDDQCASCSPNPFGSRNAVRQVN